jgi:hypothetical protein
MPAGASSPPTDQVGKREALCACLNSRFLVKNISIVSNFAQTAGAGSTFNQSGLAEKRRQAGWLPGL